MKYSEFITKYKVSKDKPAMAAKHIKTSYLKYVDKINMAQSIANASSWKEIDGKNVYMRDTCNQQFLLQMKLIQAYTDIEFKDSEVVEVYDGLAEIGALGDLIDAMPNQEIVQIQSMTSMCVDDIYTNFRDLPSYIDSKLDAIGLTADAIISAFQDVTNNESVIEDSESDK